MKRVLVLFLSLFLIGVVSAQLCSSPPTIPTEYSGRILNTDGDVINKDYEIVSYLNGYGSLGIVENGNYLIDVSSCSGSSSGTISFFINGVEANEHPTYNGQDDFGKSYILNLTFDLEPSTNSSCGNNKKDAGEVCDGNDFGGLTCSNYGFNAGELSCSDSCINIYISGCYMDSPSNNPPSPPSGEGGSSGGGGGSSGSGRGSSGGGGGVSSSPEGNDEESSGGLLGNSINTDSSNEEDNEKETTTSQEKTPITGSAIVDFVKSGRGIGILAGFIFLVVVGIGVVLIKKKTPKNE